MTPRRLLILGVLAVVAVAIGLWIAQSTTSSSSAELNAALYPALEKELNDVTAVRLFKAGDAKAVELQRVESGWTVAERSGYPADVAKLRNLLVELAEARIVEEKTSNPENYSTLGVEDSTHAAASGTRVELVGVATPVNVIIGKTTPGAKSQYVRRAGEAQSWLVNRTLDTSATADAWLRKEIIDVTADRIQSVSVAPGKAKRYTAAKSGRADANFTVNDLPKGKELSSPAAANGFATALAGLTLTDVRPASEFSTPATETAEFRAFDGLVVRVEGWTKDEKHYVALQTAFDAAQAQRFHMPTEAPKPEGAAASDGAVAAASESSAAQEKVQQEAAAAQMKLTGWVYEIPEYKYDAIFKPLDEMLKQ